MKRYITALLVVILLLSACAKATPSANAAVLKVSDGTTTKTYTVDALEKLSSSKASFKGVEYVGVSLASLLKDAGFDPAKAKAVKAVASDGFTVNYDPSLFSKADTLVAYAKSDGPLASEDGTFRMVLPDQEGKLNARMLVEIQVVQ